jgi:hypothetical protein
MHTNQGSQFTGTEFIATLIRHDTPTSLGGQGYWRELPTSYSRPANNALLPGLSNPNPSS